MELHNHPDLVKLESYGHERLAALLRGGISHLLAGLSQHEMISLATDSNAGIEDAIQALNGIGETRFRATAHLLLKAVDEDTQRAMVLAAESEDGGRAQGLGLGTIAVGGLVLTLIILALKVRKISISDKLVLEFEKLPRVAYEFLKELIKKSL